MRIFPFERFSFNSQHGCVYLQVPADPLRTRGPLAAFCQNEEAAQTPSELMSERLSGSSAACRCHGLFNRPHGENRGRHKHTHTVETGEQRNARARPDTLTAVSDRGGRAYHRRSKADKRSLLGGRFVLHKRFGFRENGPISHRALRAGAATQTETGHDHTFPGKDLLQGIPKGNKE